MGTLVGNSEGEAVGLREGLLVGRMTGFLEGFDVEVGFIEGNEVAFKVLGDDVGTELGIIVGAAVRDTLGTALGLALGDDVGTELGIIVGAAVGDTLDTVL